MEKTRNGYTEIKRLIQGYATNKAAEKIFPYTTRELADRYGLSHVTVNKFLKRNGLFARGRRWVYRNIQEREHGE